MREILFKAKDIETGKWVFGYYVFSSNKYHKILTGKWHRASGSHYSYLIDPKTLCQYTGLKDVEGNKIFEGDIIHRHLNVHYCVAFYKSKWAAYPKNIDSGIYLDSIQFEDCETIGNIHD